MAPKAKATPSPNPDAKLVKMLREEEKRRRAEWAAITDEPFPEEKLYAFEL